MFRFRENLVFLDYYIIKVKHKARQHYGYSTFKYLSQPLYQIFTIRIDVHYHTNSITRVPNLYALLANKIQGPHMNMYIEKIYTVYVKHRGIEKPSFLIG